MEGPATTLSATKGVERLLQFTAFSDWVDT